MKLILIVSIPVLCSLGAWNLCARADSSPAMSEQTVKGDVLMKEGEFYIIKDISGHEVRLHVSPETKVEGVLKTGDKIEASVTRDGHATEIRLQIPGGNLTPVLPGPDHTSPQRTP
jgi:hypothetical protein